MSNIWEEVGKELKEENKTLIMLEQARGEVLERTVEIIEGVVRKYDFEIELVKDSSTTFKYRVFLPDDVGTLHTIRLEMQGNSQIFVSMSSDYGEGESDHYQALHLLSYVKNFRSIVKEQLTDKLRKNGYEKRN